MTIANPASDPDWMPSIIIGWQMGKTILCGPHQTPFTANGFGWCYGAMDGDTMISFDPASGEPLPVHKVLPAHSRFSIFAKEEDGFELLCIEKHMSFTEQAAKTTACSQAILANEITTQLGEWGNAGAPAELSLGLAMDGVDEPGPTIMHQDGSPITAAARPRRSMDLRLCHIVGDAYAHLDLENQILWLARELAPLVDCPGLEFDARLRAQLAKVFPDLKKRWAIVADGAKQKVVKASRDRDGKPLETFITQPHGSYIHGPKSPMAPDDGTIKISIEHNKFIIQTDDWHHEASASSEEKTVLVRFDAQSWSHLAIRPAQCNAIASRLREGLQNFRTIQLSCLG